MPIFTDLHKQPIVTFAVLPLILLIWLWSQRSKAVKVFLGLVVCVAIVDVVNAKVLKPFFQRPRPLLTLENVELRTANHTGLSFPSNHATNNYAAATFLSCIYPPLTPLFASVAFLVALSRVYVGVHYPFDVLVGAIWGTLFALVFFQVWRKIFRYKTQNEEQLVTLNTDL